MRSECPSKSVTEEALEEFESYRPLAYSVCNRYLRRAEDVEDAAQETFVRFAHHRQTIQGPVISWIIAAARSCSVDLIRRHTREQRRRQQLSQLNGSTAGELHLRDLIRQRLCDALGLLSDDSRELIVQRFFRHAPLSILAINNRKSVATMSRRVA